jgi:hypothetical protein
MLEHFAAAQNAPFAIALVVMLGIALIEAVAMLIGTGLSGLLDGLFDHDVDVDVDLHAHAPADALLHRDYFSEALAWLQIGRVPILVLLVIFLTAFGLLGLAEQSAVHGVTGAYLPAALAWIAPFGLALPVVHRTGRWLARVLPMEETYAVSRDSFVGRVATIVIGTARRGAPAQARLRDEHGRTHYVMVEPDVEAAFDTGHEVLLVRVDGARYRCIDLPSDALVDRPQRRGEVR